MKQHWISWILPCCVSNLSTLPVARPCRLCSSLSEKVVNGMMQCAVRCDGCVVVVVLFPSTFLMRTHTQRKRESSSHAMTETNSWVARPVSITGGGKIALHRGEEERGMSWTGEIGQRWSVFFPPKKACLIARWLFAVDMQDGWIAEKVRQIRS